MWFKKKDPFAPISLNRKDARWFVAYLEGKERNEEVEKRRLETIEKARHLPLGADKGVEIC